MALKAFLRGKEIFALHLLKNIIDGFFTDGFEALRHQNDLASSRVPTVFYWTVDEWMFILIWQGSVCPLFFFFLNKTLFLYETVSLLCFAACTTLNTFFHALVRHKMTLACYPQVIWQAHYTLCCDTELKWGMKSQKTWLEVQLWTCLFP